jgi:hypothetical protein
MRRLLIGSAFVLASSLLGGAVTVSAHEGHHSCAVFGQSANTIAPGGGLGELVSDLAITGPGAVAELVSAEHDLFCAS